MSMQQQTQGQPPPGHQHIVSSSRNRWSWQMEGNDVPDRRFVIENIMKLFPKKNSVEYQAKLPDMVRRLEEALYRDAASKEEYKDLSTLEKRLQCVAKQLSAGRSMAANSRSSTTMIPTPGAATMIPTPGLKTTPVSFAGSSGNFAMPSSRRNNGAPSTSSSNPSVPHSGAGGLRMVQPSPNMVTSSQMHSPLVNGRLDSPFIGNAQYSLDSNTLHSTSSYFGQGQIQRERFQIHKSLNGDVSGGQCAKMIPVPGLPSQMLQKLQLGDASISQSDSQNKKPIQNQKKPDVVRPQNVAQDGDKEGNATGDRVNGATRPASDRLDLLKKQQRWLCLLRHANNCSAAEGECSVNPQCHHVRQILRHATKCRETACRTSHCQMVRVLLRHHSQCQNAQCVLCSPARRLARAKLKPGSVTAGSSSATPSTCTEEKQVATKRAIDETDIQSYDGVATSGEFSGHSVSKRTKVQLGISKGKGQLVAQQLEINASASPDDNQRQDEAQSQTSPAVKVELAKVASSSADISEKPASGKSKVVGISFLEFFTREQILEHIASVRQSQSKAEKKQAREQQHSESACCICGVETLFFDPAPLYCSNCTKVIQRNSSYRTAGSGETRNYICSPCFDKSKTQPAVVVRNQEYVPSEMEKKRNDEKTEEAWVQCDRCNAWLHQICALFNGKKNEGGDAEFICPHCLLNDLERGVRQPLPMTSVLGAKDLPRTALSDHLEFRLLRSLRTERAERADALGKSSHEVPGAEELVVRVVSSMYKKLEVQKRFLEIFKDVGYPSEFHYKSKAILLFQKIEGVEVCIFAMYVQEYGAECPEPNNRRLYIAYLDSVKYFRPDVRTIHGEALRTFVYHEILLGYLDYSKERGFHSCYIWSCSSRGEDYILYSHPETQKTPRDEKLREWYLRMLTKGKAEGIVVELTNLYDYFFVSPDECKALVTCARLPYFDGDCWPGEVREVFDFQDKLEKRRLHKKGISKKGVAKRVGMQSEPSTNASRDLQLMHKLSQTIHPVKENLILVHLYYTCRHCRHFITSGCLWVCDSCVNFQLCDRCYIADQKRDEKDRHPCNKRETHQLSPSRVKDIPADTKDTDDTMDSEFFDTREAFLSLCQGNHYQHDTLRRAKHSSMMVLYHLHNPTAPAFVTSCNLCNQEIETGRGWRCETCVDFDVCATCYDKEGEKHPHELKRQLERNAQSQEARQKRHLQLKKVLLVLIHAAECPSPQCEYPKCRGVKNLFRHGTVCRTRASGGCCHCKMMWHLLQLHARACTVSVCRVPRCKDLKSHGLHSQMQTESRRRASMQELVKEREKEASTSNT